MIHVSSVAQLVDHEVADDLGALEHQAHVQADRALSRARAPTRALPADHHAAEIKADFPREWVQSHTELGARHAHEPGHEGLARVPLGWMRCIHAQARRSVLVKPDARGRHVFNRPASAEQAEFDLDGLAVRGLGREPEQFARASLGPIAMPRDEPLDRGDARPRRHDDLDAPAWKHAHRHASRTSTDAHVPRRADLAFRPQRQLSG
jgi:hypothetical protein